MLMSADQFWQSLPVLLEGAAWTALLTLGTLLFGLVIALPVAWCRLAPHRLANAFALTFVFVFRGAPLLVLLFLIYYGGPEIDAIRHSALWTAFRDAVFCAILALSLNSAGYLSEVLAGAVRGVPAGELEAATVAGLGRWTIATRVLLPNALRLGLRNYGNEVIFVIKGTAVASLVTITELTAAANRIYFRTFDPITPLLAAAALYFVVIWGLSLIMRFGERRLSPQLRRPRAR